MNDQTQQELGFPGSRPNQHLRRGVYLFPSFLTVANLLCGFYAILATLKGGVADLDHAACALGFAILFDSLDGFAARALGTSSEFGKQLDSLADMVSFGIAPAILAFTWGVRGMLQSDAVEARHIYQFGWLISLAFVVCTAWRLARFNVHGMAPGGSRYFVGLPCPAAAGVIAATVHALNDPIEDWRWSVGWLAVMTVVAALMVSTVRYRSFKDMPWAKRQPSVMFVVMALLFGSIVFYSQPVLMTIATSYVFFGVAWHVIRFVRHRLVSHPA